MILGDMGLDQAMRPLDSQPSPVGPILQGPPERPFGVPPAMQPQPEAPVNPAIGGEATLPPRRMPQMMQPPKQQTPPMMGGRSVKPRVGSLQKPGRFGAISK